MHREHHETQGAGCLGRTYQVQVALVVDPSRSSAARFETGDRGDDGVYASQRALDRSKIPDVARRELGYRAEDFAGVVRIARQDPDPEPARGQRTPARDRDDRSLQRRESSPEVPPNRFVDARAAFFYGLQVEANKGELVLLDAEDGDPTHQMTGAVYARASHLPLDPHGRAVDDLPDGLRLQVGDRSEDLRPVATDDVRPDGRPGRVSRRLVGESRPEARCGRR